MTTSTLLLAAFAGGIASLGLIAAIGPQNAFVLRQGLAGRFVVPVVAIGALSDALMFALATVGVGMAVTAAPQLITVVRLAGAAFLLGYGLLCLHRARRPESLQAQGRAAGSAKAAIGTALALTYLNPHLYLDVILMGSLANNQPGGGRWAFWLGASLASAGWFTALGLGAARLRPLFAQPRAWRILDLSMGLLMLALGVRLLLG